MQYVYSDTKIQYTRHNLIKENQHKALNLGRQIIASVFAVATFSTNILIELHIAQGQTEVKS